MMMMAMRQTVMMIFFVIINYVMIITTYYLSCSLFVSFVSKVGTEYTDSSAKPNPFNGWVVVENDTSQVSQCCSVTSHITAARLGEGCVCGGGGGGQDVHTHYFVLRF